jgi:hypothetical protein
MGENINLDMLTKLVRDVQAEQKAMRAEMQQGFAALTQKVDAQSTTLVTMRRDIRSLQGDCGYRPIRTGRPHTPPCGDREGGRRPASRITDDSNRYSREIVLTLTP